MSYVLDTNVCVYYTLYVLKQMLGIGGVSDLELCCFNFLQSLMLRGRRAIVSLVSVIECVNVFKALAR